MARKTNKTSHVMDLLTNGTSPETTEPGNGPVDAAASAEVSGSKGDPPSHAASPPNVTVVDEGQNDRISQEILNKLSEELMADRQDGAAPPEPAAEPPQAETKAAGKGSLTGSAGPSQAMPTVPPSGTDATAQPSDTEPPTHKIEEDPTMPSEQNMTDESGSLPEQENLENAEGAAEAPTEGSAAEEAPTEEMPAEETPDNVPAEKGIHRSIIPNGQIGKTLLNDEYHFVNVMEQLILRQDVDAFLNQYNVCTCKRCVADVCALALTGLPAKYVVSSKDSLSPLLSYYESKYKIYMLTELIKACNKVRENPRHKR